MADIAVPEPVIVRTTETTNPGTSSASADPTSPIEQFEVDNRRANEADDESQYPQGPKLYAIVAVLIMILISLGFDVAVVAVTIPALSNHFHSIKDIGWYSTSLRLVMCSFMFAFGKAYTLFDVKVLFMLSLIVSCVGNTICTFAQTSNMFIVGRAVCGWGTSGIAAGVWVIFTQSFPLRRRPFWGGIAGTIETLAAVSAPLIGGALIDGWTWRACFGINLPIGIITIVVAWYTLDLPRHPNAELPLNDKIVKMDIMGTCVFVPGVVCLLLGLQWGGLEYSWANSRIISLFVLAGVLFALFGYIQYRSGENASLPLRILRMRSLLAGALFSCCCNSTISVVEYYMSIYFQGVRGFSAARAGVLALPMIAGMSVACLLAGWGTSKIGYYFPFMWASTILMSLSTGLITTINLDTNLALLLFWQAMLGFATGFGIQAPQVAAQTVLDPKEVSIGIAIVQFGSQMGPVIFISSSAALFTNRLSEEIMNRAPGANMTSIENMGLTQIRDNFGGERLKNVLLGYDDAVVQTLYLPLAVACLSVVGAVAIERRSVKKKQE